MEGETVCAIVVTHNRRDLLLECLQSLLRQTRLPDQIYVVDNASSDGTAELLKDRFAHNPIVCHIRLDRNEGAAGGFYVGIKQAVADGFDWVWLIDDDSEAREDALANLLCASPASSPDTAGLCPTTVDTTGRVLPNRGYFRPSKTALTLNHYAAIVRLTAEEHAAGDRVIDWASYLGLLVPTGLIKQVGLPRREFFLWNDDLEWTLRLSRFGKLWLIPCSLVVHKGVVSWPQTSRARWLSKAFGIGWTPLPLDAYWRHLCAFRNYTWILKHYMHESTAGFIFRMVLAVAVVILYCDHPAERVRWLIDFGIQGRQGRFRRLTPEFWRNRKRRPFANHFRSAQQAR